jgi:hypothetical protein
LWIDVTSIQSKMYKQNGSHCWSTGINHFVLCQNETHSSELC